MTLQRIPGLIDAHVHLRDPGQTEKEDFSTGTSAAIAGGFVTVIDMPNNTQPITTYARLDEKRRLVKQKAVCTVGLYAGSLGDNPDELRRMEPYVMGLKLYLNKTTGNFLINAESLERIFSYWDSKKPILVHGEEDILPDILQVVAKTRTRLHVCHVSKKSELSLILAAKKAGLPVTCGVTPHHLFLTNEDVKTLGTHALMKPELGTIADQNYLWEHLSEIDIIESDHAPHTITEKQSGNPPYGVPNLDTTLPLLLTAVAHKRLTIDEIIRLCHTNPAHIFSVPTDSDTYVEVDTEEEYVVTKADLKTKCAWSPFEGWKMKGRVKRVVIKGRVVFENGRVIAKPGSGSLLPVHT